MALSNMINLHRLNADLEWGLEGPSDDPTRLDGEPSPGSVADAIRAGRFPGDRAFDRLLPLALRIVSSQHWTPIVAAVRAAEWIERLGIQTVVDIGSGAGKFCVVAALASRAQFTGFEQRAGLVIAARELANTLQVDERVEFLHGTLGETLLPKAQAYYLYNPFGENLLESEDHLDQDVELSDGRYLRDVAAVEQLLRDAPIDTYVLTYNGFGGEIPATYRGILADYALPNVLRMYRKTRWASSGQPHYAEALSA
jgi:predicted RNA methylase